MTDTGERFAELLYSGGGGPGDAAETMAGEGAPDVGPVTLTPFVDALPIPPLLRPSAQRDRERMTIDLRATWVRLHSQLPPTRAWGYEGHVPGPTIEVWRNQRLTVAWRNRLAGEYPVAAWEVPMELPPASNRPGRAEVGAKEVKGVADLPPWTVTHLHGAPTSGSNDGWPENAVSPAEIQYATYPNSHRACALWYHDHAMHITRWNVYTGLAGMYLVRDEEETALGLPRGKHEIPLILADRNLDTDHRGRLTGRLLHKTEIIQQNEAGDNVTLPFSGPYTLVNGVVWPHLTVSARWYRFRLLNASNARVYRLALIDEATGEPVSGAVQQIGTDGGLLGRPVPVDAPLPVAPAERVDLLIDFSRLRGRTLRLVNTTAAAAPGEPDPANGVPYPQVMQFRVARERVHDSFTPPEVLSPSFRRITHDDSRHEHEHEHRLVVLTPPGTVGGMGHPEIWEMREVDADHVSIPGDGVIQVQDETGRTRTYERTARSFQDPPGFTVEQGAWEQWTFFNLASNQINLPAAAATPMHPMHIHLIAFQAVGRHAYDISGFDPALGGTRAPLTHRGAVPVAPYEAGWKDTIQVPGEQLVTVLGRFKGGAGRFVYHCHVLEHEDTHMMRQFLVQPAEVMRLGTHLGDHGHGASEGTD
ncbi:O-aminophenol oxidase PhsA [Streptomyces sp. DSM 41534]